MQRSALIFVIAMLFAQTVFSAGQEAIKEPATGIVFPSELGVWIRTGHKEYGDGFGVSFGYKFEGAAATIYVYNLTLKNIPTGIGSAVVKEHFEQARTGIADYYKESGSAKLELSNEVRVGTSAESPKALRAVFTIEHKGSELASHLYLTGYKNQFFKVRLSCPKRDEKALQPAIEKLLNEIGKLLK